MNSKCPEYSLFSIHLSLLGEIKNKLHISNFLPGGFQIEIYELIISSSLLTVHHIHLFCYFSFWQILPHVYSCKEHRRIPAPCNQKPKEEEGVTPELVSSHWQAEASTLEPSWGLGSTFGSLSHRHSLGLGLSLGLWPAETETLGNMAPACFLSLGWAMQASWLSLQLPPFRILGLISLGFTRALIASACALMALELSCTFFRPSLLRFLAKRMLLRILGSIPLRDSDLCDQVFFFFLNAVSAPFSWLVCGVVLGLGHVYMKPAAPELSGTAIFIYSLCQMQKQHWKNSMILYFSCPQPSEFSVCPC